MRKDFLVHPYQVSEACYAGAAGVLLIAGILSDSQLETMIKRAQKHHMFVLVEVFNKKELEQSISVIAKLNNQPSSIMLGVNCRDLKTLKVNFSWFEQLAEALPKGLVCVAESGINVPSDIRKIVKWGYKGALIGTTLMQANDPAQTLLEFRQAAITAQQTL
jgi:indole-3-glycerol phosphate synthase